MNPLIDLRSSRARQARLGRTIGKTGFVLLLIIGSLAGLGGVVLIVRSGHLGWLLIALGLLCLLPALWWKQQLSVLPPSGPDLANRLSVDVLVRLGRNLAMQPQAVWAAISDHWQARFITNHLLLGPKMVSDYLGTTEAELAQALQLAAQLAEQNSSSVIELGYVVAGLMLASPKLQQLLIKLKAQPADVVALANWLGRNLGTGDNHHSFGGIGRDWSFGFTPLLNQFAQNISLAVANAGDHFGWLDKSDGVMAVEAAFANKASAVVLIGANGIGKTNSVYALAQKLMEGRTVPELAYHQIFAISATDITSRAQRPGDLEHIMLSLANEAAHASHVILFLDDAASFMSSAPGSFDATQILLSIIQARAVPLILAMAAEDFQRLKSTNQGLASLLTPVVLQELPETDVLRVLEDAALGLEQRNNVLIAYEALTAAYRLSGRYNQDEAYPGRALKLLEQALAHSQNSVVNAASVAAAVEQTTGVKVAGAEPAEADELLHLEDDIHRRMINQSHAVSVVANALRRSRAGVTNPKRPIGSFLFLGPTGVGKTELAKSVAATYFGAETSLIRLDMSEYQQAEDVARLLATGQAENASLLMSVRERPYGVVLLDEIEKAHPNILNLLLQLLDEGQLTDASGRAASFKDSIIIATSNALANEIRGHIDKGESLEAFASNLSDELIASGQFKPELLNRFDELVFFRPLTPEELGQVVGLMVKEVNATLTNQNISFELTPAATAKIVAQGNDPRLGARPMRRELQRVVENSLAQKILRGEAQPGDHLVLDEPDLSS